MEIFEVILAVSIFFPTKWLTYMITNEWGVPRFLDYMPYKCCKCLTFWTLTALFMCCGLLHLWVTMGVGLALTVMDTIAVIIDERNNTIKI